MAIRRSRANLAPSHRNHTSKHDAETRATESAIRKRSRRLGRRLLALACLGLIITDTGCSIMTGTIKAVRDTECLDEFMTNYRNRALAEKAWHCRQDRFSLDNYRRDFKLGFIDGYLEIANGGPGCCPSIAPSRYWGWQYQSAHGQQAINAWFAGYPFGVVAAEEDGVGNWNQVVTLSGTKTGKYGSGACTSCGTTGGTQGSGLPGMETMPAMPGQEVIPTPTPEMGIEGGGVEMLSPPPADAAMRTTVPLSSASAQPEFIARREWQAEDGVIDAQSSEVEFNGPTGPASSELDLLFLTPSRQSSDPLPFTFE